MNSLTLSAGIVTALIGLVIIVVTFMFSRNHLMGKILTGMVFAILGVVIVWLSVQEAGNPSIKFVISERQGSLLLVGFVMSLFILKGILDIREGSKNLQDKSISSSLALKSKFQIFVAILVTGWVVLLLLVAFMQFGR
jgi:hypothetical protein